jgi:selenocysteine lyase/cysteine desulfurase
MSPYTATLNDKSLDSNIDFQNIRNNIVGIDAHIDTPLGRKPLIYTDWTASGRLYAPIEELLSQRFGALVGNTHSESTCTGTTMTHAYHEAIHIIKKHVNADAKDALISCGSGMTAAVNKLQRILGLKIHERYQKHVPITGNDRPVIFVTHMEHHSNQTSWIETIGEVIVVEPTDDGLVSLANLKFLLEKYSDRKLKIGAFTSCSNVTGIFTPYHEMAKLMHQYNGWCFVDFAASAPYIDINMHPTDESEKLDAIYFSPHKFLGGPGTPGILILNSDLYQNQVPDNIGGGIVNWTNPWGGHSFVNDIETREDAGTPAFLQTIKAALSVLLKEKMTVSGMQLAEQKINSYVFDALSRIDNVNILAESVKERLSIFSFYINNIHYNLVVKLLNDYFGIQARGGCSCAGTYGHYLLSVGEDYSQEVTSKIDIGDNTEKPGWIRISFHPSNTMEEIDTTIKAIEYVQKNIIELQKNYTYSSKTNEFYHNSDFSKNEKAKVKQMFEF